MFLLKLVLLLLTAETATPSSTCQAQCGNITIPYPFGIGRPNCFRPGFNLTCNRSSTSAPKLYLGDGTVEVLDILLTHGQVLINSNIGFLYCNPEDPTQDSNTVSWTGLHENGPYTFSSIRNTFITISCGAISYVNSTSGLYGSTFSVCASVCLNGGHNGLCSGIGCCQTSFGLSAYSLTVRVFSILNETLFTGMRPCTKAFVVHREWFRNHSEQLDEKFYGPKSKVPVLLDWAIRESTSSSCQYARNNPTTFACQSENTDCYNVETGIGYLCNCSKGFAGNPYISNGCQDINECELDTNPCFPGECVNHIGNYSCLHHKGTISTNIGDRYDHSSNKFPTDKGITININGIEKFRILVLAVSGGVIGLGFLVLVAVIFLLFQRLEKISVKKHREKCFHRNQGLLLQQQLTSIEDDVQRTKIFTLEELEKATNNFDVTRILGRGGHGTVYKGILSDKRVVAIKKSEITVQSEIAQFINEVVVLSQINHRNVVKLFGCCLEADIPLLVYEFISGGTLSSHLHVIDNQASSLSFENRVGIATEIAGALAYLHSSASTSIIHRDIKSSNILLDYNHTAKISDFGASRSIPSDKTRVTTKVQGTFGYLDPEYYHTGQLTEKSDVYSFGVILVELLTGERAISHNLLIQEKNLAMHFIFSLKENHLFQILDARVAEEGSKEQIEAIALLADMCLKINGEERPTMKMTEEMLNGLNKFKKNKYVRKALQKQTYEDTERFRTNAPSSSNTVVGAN